MNNDAKVQNFLSEVTDALLMGDDTALVRSHYEMNDADSLAFIALIEQLHSSLGEVQPNPDFARQLKQELTGTAQPVVVQRIRALPARVQLAAAAALFTGFLLLLQRFFLGDGHRRTREQTLSEKTS